MTFFGLNFQFFSEVFDEGFLLSGSNNQEVIEIAQQATELN